MIVAAAVTAFLVGMMLGLGLGANVWHLRVGEVELWGRAAKDAFRNADIEVHDLGATSLNECPRCKHLEVNE